MLSSIWVVRSCRNSEFSSHKSIFLHRDLKIFQRREGENRVSLGLKSQRSSKLCSLNDTMKIPRCLARTKVYEWFSTRVGNWCLLHYLNWISRLKWAASDLDFSQLGFRPGPVDRQDLLLLHDHLWFCASRLQPLILINFLILPLTDLLFQVSNPGILSTTTPLTSRQGVGCPYDIYIYIYIHLFTRVGFPTGIVILQTLLQVFVSWVRSIYLWRSCMPWRVGGHVAHYTQILRRLFG